jgi:dihydropteroate synthase
MLLRARQFTFAFPRPALLMGVVNATPDSFFDGARFADANAAVAHALRLVEEGADMIDIGGESSRPGAAPVSEWEELRRVLPVLEALAGAVSVPLSIDTVKPGVARQALRAGACIINDIAANREDDEMWRLAAESGAAYVAVHMQGSPATMQENPFYDDVVADVDRFFENRLNRLLACGVNQSRWCWTWGWGLENGWRTICGCLRACAALQNGSARCCWERPANPFWERRPALRSGNAWRRRWPALVGASKMGRGLFAAMTWRPRGTPCG